MRLGSGSDVRWGDPSYFAVYHVLTNPVYAGRSELGRKVALLNYETLAICRALALARAVFAAAVAEKPAG